MSFGDVGFRTNKDAHRPCPASLPIRVPAVVLSLSLLSATPHGFTLRVATVHVTIPINSFHLMRLHPCRAHLFTLQRAGQQIAIGYVNALKREQ